jgi:site-specific recombinase XerD
MRQTISSIKTVRIKPETAESTHSEKGASAVTLTKHQAQKLLRQPDTSTIKGLRDRAILAAILGCGLQRSEVVGLRVDSLQRRDGHTTLVLSDRAIPVPTWTQDAINAYLKCGRHKRGPLFRSIKARVSEGMTSQDVYNVVTEYAKALRLNGVSPETLRLTFAKLAHNSGADLSQLTATLGHVSSQATERLLRMAGIRRSDINSKPISVPGEGLGLTL